MNNTNFDNLFNAVEETAVDINACANGTGYYDDACFAEAGKEITRFTTANNRRGLIVPLAPGQNAVIFERYSGGESGVLVSNFPSRYGALEAMLGMQSQVSDEAVGRLAGDAMWLKEKVSDAYRFLEMLAA